MFWTPALAGVTLQETFSEFINDGKEGFYPETRLARCIGKNFNLNRPLKESFYLLTPSFFI
jgi:hypothetical protein